MMIRFAVLSLLVALVVLVSGGSGAQPAAQDPSAPRASQPKLIRTQGSNPRSAQVRCGLQDIAGELWFGTSGEGVYRYDGRGFYQYTVEDGLDSNIVWSILEDRNGTIWFGTEAGLSRWDGKSIRSVSAASATGSAAPEPSPDRTPLPRTAVWSMLEDKEGTIWIGTADGMYVLQDGVISSFLANAAVQNPSELHLRMVDDMLQDRRGDLWFASGMPPGMEGLCRFDGTSVTQFKPGGERWIRTLVEDSAGVLWMGTRHQGVWRYDGEEFSQYPDQRGLGAPMLVDRVGNIWFSGEEHEDGFHNSTGIWRYDGTTFRNFSTRDGMGAYGVWSMIEDRDGNIWVGTRNTGLYRYDGESFTCFSEDPGPP